MPLVVVAGGGGGRPGKFVGGDLSSVPVCPEDTVGFDVKVHGVDANAGIALEGLLVAPVGHAGVQAADFIVVSNVEDLTTTVSVVSFASVIDSGKILVAAALEGSFGVVAHVRAHSKLLALIFISTSVMTRLLKAWFTGAEGVSPIDHTVGLVSITTLSPVTPAVVQLCVCLAVNLVRAIVFTVIEKVAAQSGADALAVGTHEFIFLTCHWSGLAVNFI